jgi:hypothetical protein
MPVSLYTIDDCNTAVNGTDQGIRCRFISEWYKVDTYVPDKEGLLSEIKKNNPDVVLMDMNLYAEIDGIETTRTIRSQYNIPVIPDKSLNPYQPVFHTCFREFLKPDRHEDVWSGGYLDPGSFWLSCRIVWQ